MVISGSSVRRIAKHDLGLAPLKRTKGQKLSEADREKRLVYGNKLLCNLTRDI